MKKKLNPYQISYIRGLLVNERKQCSHMVIEGQGYLDGDLNDEERAQIQDIMDGAYERCKVINHQIEQLDKV